MLKAIASREALGGWVDGFEDSSGAGCGSHSRGAACSDHNLFGPGLLGDVQDTSVLILFAM